MRCRLAASTDSATARAKPSAPWLRTRTGADSRATPYGRRRNPPRGWFQRAEPTDPTSPMRPLAVDHAVRPSRLRFEHRLAHRLAHRAQGEACLPARPMLTSPSGSGAGQPRLGAVGCRRRRRRGGGGPRQSAGTLRTPRRPREDWPGGATLPGAGGDQHFGLKVGAGLAFFMDVTPASASRREVPGGGCRWGVANGSGRPHPGRPQPVDLIGERGHERIEVRDARGVARVGQLLDQPVTFGLCPSPLTAWSSYSSESAMLTFCRGAASKVGLPDPRDVFEGDRHPRRDAPRVRDHRGQRGWHRHAAFERRRDALVTRVVCSPSSQPDARDRCDGLVRVCPVGRTARGAGTST